MLSKKSFLANERNVLAPLVRPTRGNVRDHIESHKSDRRPSYMPCRGLRRRRQRKTDLREIFGAAQFSTFSTASVKNGSVPARAACPFDPVLTANQARAYWWCSPPRIGRHRMRPDASAARDIGASLFNDK